jgi:biotin carboxyl carrier protein
MIERVEKLRKLLTSLFSKDELHRFAQDTWGEDVANAINWDHSYEHVVSEVTTSISRRGLITPEFFERLVDQRPQRSREIMAQASAYRAATAPAHSAAAGGTTPTSEATATVPRGNQEKAPPYNVGRMCAAKLFIAYAHDDAQLRANLDQHLAVLKELGVLEIWHDRPIGTSVPWRGIVSPHLGEIDVVLLLVSAAFAGSGYCLDDEFASIATKQQLGQLEIVSVLLKPSLWDRTQWPRAWVLPSTETAVTTWSNQDSAWTDVAAGIRRIAESAASRKNDSRELAYLRATTGGQGRLLALREIRTTVNEATRTSEPADAPWLDVETGESFGGGVLLELKARIALRVHRVPVASWRSDARIKSWTTERAPGRVIAEHTALGPHDTVAIVEDRLTSEARAVVCATHATVIEMTEDAAEVLPGGTLVRLRVDLANASSSAPIQLSNVGTQYGQILRWQPALTDPAWRTPGHDVARQVRVISSMLVFRHTKHTTTSPSDGTISFDREAIYPDLFVSRDTALCKLATKQGTLVVAASASGTIVGMPADNPKLVRANEELFTLRQAAPRVRISVQLEYDGPPNKYTLLSPLPGVVSGDERAAAALPGGAFRERHAVLTVDAFGIPCDIDTDANGVVTRCLVRAGDAVSFGQPLMRVDLDSVSVESPHVGTFYRAREPHGAPIVRQGQRVKPGDTLCIVEALKIFNEIESEVNGVVESILTEDTAPVEFRQVLMRIKCS